MIYRPSSTDEKQSFAHDSSVAVALSSSHSLGAYNNGHTVRAYALTQMLGFSLHFVCPQPLYAITEEGVRISLNTIHILLSWVINNGNMEASLELQS
jgi:hypothetical protein